MTKQKNEFRILPVETRALGLSPVLQQRVITEFGEDGTLRLYVSDPPHVELIDGKFNYVFDTQVFEQPNWDSGGSYFNPIPIDLED